MSKSPIDVASNIHHENINHSVIQNTLGLKKESKKDAGSKDLGDGLHRAGCATRAQIIDAAAERFIHYGYGKTTIADIATDCKMSAGNIYRYFESKVDIAAAILHDNGVQIITDMHKKVNQKTKARDKLRVFLFSGLRVTFRQLASAPRMREMILAVREHRPEIRRKIRRLERDLFAEILKYGRKTGEFRLDCVKSAARIIQCLVSRFRWPQMRSPHNQLSRLETELEGTLAMILSALGAGCLLGAIMRGHPKSKNDHDHHEELHEEPHDGQIANKALKTLQ